MTEGSAASLLASFGAVLLVCSAASRRRRPVPASPSSGSDLALHAPGAVERIGAIPVLLRLSDPGRLEALAEAAGDDRTVRRLAGMKWVWAGSGTFVAWLVLPTMLAPAVGMAAFRLPDMGLARAARRRRLQVERELPLFLDLLAAGVGAGLTGQLAVRRATEATQGPLAEELSDALRRVDLGGRWRVELPAVGERLDLPDLRRAVAVLVRSDALGSSLTDALGDIAREARDARRAAVAERARKAPVKMLFPLVFLVLPAFLLLTVVPVLVTTLQSIR